MTTVYIQGAIAKVVRNRLVVKNTNRASEVLFSATKLKEQMSAAVRFPQQMLQFERKTSVE